MMATWTITMLDTGTQTLDKGVMTYLADMGREIQIPVTVALLQGPRTILVDTSSGRYCIAGDAAMHFENLEKRIPPGFHTSVVECMASLERIAREADRVLPSHEPTLFARQPTRFP